MKIQINKDKSKQQTLKGLSGGSVFRLTNPEGTHTISNNSFYIKVEGCPTINAIRLSDGLGFNFSHDCFIQEVVSELIVSGY
jgi:hypothetical protein